ncbi:hypothetical protein IE53DRAFT_372061 [Violaceomyces palustris]|uniref:Uncharacterized protein n=1 Tax=Violaceomyces palustris TaxID=1673888 RepID=A0ACD0NLQ7_9BASI|nr:hypothetical protein IE53DRAFT_372061 [Violaceomyces palustris]
MKDLATYATNPSFSRFKSPEDEKKGLNLPAFTTFLVRQGILYWLITLVFHIIGLVFLASPKVNPILHTTNVNLLAAIEMAMAGRIFRGTRTWVKEHVNKNLLLQSKRPTSRENSSPQPGRRQSNNSASAATEVGERPLSALEKGGAGEDYDRDELSEEAASTYRGTGKNFTSDDTFVIGRSPSVTSGTATVVGDTPRLGGTTKDVWASFTTSTTSPRQPSLFDLRQGRDDAERRQYDRDSLHDSAPRWSASRTMTTRTDLPPAQVAPSWHVHTTRRNENTLSGGSFEKRLSFGSNAPSLGGGKRFGLGIFEKQAGAESNSDPSSPPSPPQPLQHSISISTLRAKAEAEASSVIGPSNPRSLTSKLQHKDVLEGGAVDIAGPIAQTFEEYKAEPPKEHRYTSKGTPRYQGPFGSPDADSGRGASMDGASLRSDGEVGDGRFELAVVTPNLPPRSTVQSITSEDEEDGCEEERRGKGESGEGWTNKVKSPSQLTFGSKKSDSMTRSDPGGGSGGGWV